MTGLRARPWQPQRDGDRDWHARYAPHPRVSMADVWRMVAAPAGRFIARHARAVAAAMRAYKGEM